jgi:alginate O-acetyltransferase complex protein AlgI
MDITLANVIRVAGAIQLSILIASSLVPFRLNFKRDLAVLPTLHRQLYWTYGGYVVMGIIALGLISLTCADELASGSRLARAFCIYGALFWGVRVSLQAVFDVKPHLTAWWLTAGYHTLTVLFVFNTGVYLFAACR